MLLYAILFVSGASILALELLASRIMTPYFGVSLYIWTGILSITLLALALGYWAGGRLAARPAGAKSHAARLLRLYAWMPAIAAAGIVGACLVYPHTFGALANWSLVAGAFAAALIFLLVPLVATSAMNPLLVALLLEKHAGGDAGAGKVFFVSTLGSVAGVFATAFVLIPYVSNYTATLIVAGVLAALTVVVVVAAPPGAAKVAGAGAAGIAALLLCAGMLWQADSYTGRQGPFSYGGVSWRLEASESSLFGTVKVLKSEEIEAGRFVRMYFHDGLTQNTVDSNNRSVSFYTYALEGLARMYGADAKRTLVLGLGAGMVPMRLAERGLKVDVVDIDPVARRIAAAYFGFDTARVATHVADARTFVGQCRGAYDVAVVDLFHGDGTPEYLVTREFFRDLARCLTDGGVAVFNTFADLERPRAYAHLLATLRSELPHLALYRPDAGGSVHVNSFIVASAKPLREPRRVTFDDVPARHQTALWNMLGGPIPLGSELLEGGRVITDAVSAAAHDFADMQLAYRRTVVEGMPSGMLMN
ncbi:MAG TPA: fused MFS/spermidine synthase [Burkholderiales bacterium]|nr:fused MFS/spermidine synthase [Burkholderiales bacterium]